MRVQSWVFLAGLAVLAAVLPAGACKPKATKSIDPSAYLEAIGPDVMVPAHRSFRARALELKVALTEASLPADAQDAFVQAMLQWQELEVLQVGPAAAVGSPAGGEGLRDRIYSWPTVDPCAVDSFLVSGEPSDRLFFADALVDEYGLDALEHLLFSGPEAACGDWGVLSTAEVDARRLVHARLLAADVAEAADALLVAWEGDYPRTLVGGAVQQASGGRQIL